ncbi:hypothetical protein H0H87_007210, partial [Tephrocybe sp. NHM501043]
GLEDHHSDLVLEAFNAAMEQNDYEIPGSLRNVIADERVVHIFSQQIAELRDAFRDWHPKTTILRDLKRFQVLRDLKHEGFICAIGLSNFDAIRTDAICTHLGPGTIVSNQVQVRNWLSIISGSRDNCMDYLVLHR